MKKLHTRWSQSTLLQKQLARQGLCQLGLCKLEVILTPAPIKMHACHMVRTVINHNPGWYKILVERRVSSGHLRIRVKRALCRVICGWIDPQGLDLEILSELNQAEEK